MKKLLTISFLFLFCFLAHAQGNLSALIPLPNHIEQVKKKAFKITEGKTTIVFEDKSLQFEAEQLAKIIKERMGVTLPVSQKAEKQSIVLKINPELKGKEHYTLEVAPKQMTLCGSTDAAVYWAIMTLDQILLGDVCNTAKQEIAALRIDDNPRFGYRALMLDPARNFHPVADVKFYIDQMVRYKYNVLQIHLTDDQGWRMEIKSQPKLASKQHYTQDDIRDIIAYAEERHVDVVPEVDVPGHTVAILAAYPELACKHLHDSPVKVDETTNRMVCAANEKTYTILKDVVREVCALFKSPYFHLGGDEAAVPANWAKCPDCNEMMKQKGYTKATQLMIPFFNNVLSFVREGGKKPILWCELDNVYPPANDYLFPYPKDVTLVTWRNGLTPTCQKLTQQNGNPLIMAPGEYAYFDYLQWKGDFPEFGNWGMPTTSLQKTYELDPGYGRPAAEQAHILGVMGTLWGEAIRDINRATYMTYPRAFALAEAAWTQMEHRSWESFKERIYPNITLLMKSGVSVRVPFEIAR